MTDAQTRYRELTDDCGLNYEAAMHALGRRSGGLEEYRTLGRREQSIAVRELEDRGLTLIEACRVVGLPVGSISSMVNPTPRKKRRLDPPQRKPALVADSSRCFGCKEAKETILINPGGVYLCALCRKRLKKQKRRAKQRAAIASNYAASFHPEFHGLKGILK